jgi:hypothetical protein
MDGADMQQPLKRNPELWRRDNRKQTSPEKHNWRRDCWQWLSNVNLLAHVDSWPWCDRLQDTLLSGNANLILEPEFFH